MITLDGSIRRTFQFPADPDTTLRFFGDLSRIVRFLPHIQVVEVYSGDELRVLYQTVELGAYTINIFCDIGCQSDLEGSKLLIQPLPSAVSVSSASTLNTTTGYGFYSSESLFRAVDGITEIDYSLNFRARFPRPHGLRMMPGRIVHRIARSISDGRVEEMASGFMRNATAAFPEWLAHANGSSPREIVSGKR
jgi:hypothetical protein